jgi:hydrogenase nickel incorporation protein HypA/HybF
MHEFSLIADLIRKIQSIACEHGAEKIIGVKVRLGALSHTSPEHFREHFVQIAQGTIAEGAEIDIEVSTDLTDPYAQTIILDAIEIEE